MRREVPDPNDKLYTTYVFIVAGLLHLKREEVPATKSEIISLTTVSASTVNRALPVLEEQGLLKQVGKVWEFAVVVPDHLMTGNFGVDNNGQIQSLFDSFKEEIKTAIRNIPQSPIHDEMDLGEIEKAIDKVKPKKVKQKGAKGLMGNMGL